MVVLNYLYLIGHLYGNNFNENIFKKPQLKYISPNVWRLMYLMKKKEVYKNHTKKMWCRSSHIPLMFNKHKIHIHSGKKWVIKNVNKWMVGFRAGEFSWNRRFAMYKAKQLRKKKKKTFKGSS